MCKLCDAGFPSRRFDARRGFLKARAAAGLVAGLAPAAAAIGDAGPARPPEDSGRRGRRYLIRGGSVRWMAPKVGDFAEADVLVEGRRIVAVGPNLAAAGAGVIDARGRIVMPGF